MLYSKSSKCMTDCRNGNNNKTSRINLITSLFHEKKTERNK